MAGKNIVSAAAQQQIESLTMSRDDGRSGIRVGMRPRPIRRRDKVGLRSRHRGPEFTPSSEMCSMILIVLTMSLLMVGFSKARQVYRN